MSKTHSGFAAEENSSTEVATIDSRKFKIKTVELQDCLNTLPHGFFVNGQRLQTFELKGYDPEQDLKLGTLYSNQKADIKQILGNFLPTIIKTIGSRTFKEIASELNATPQQLVERMPLGDALSIVLNARLRNVGSAIALDDQCPNCQTRNNDDPVAGRPYHNLNDVKIGLIPQITDKLVVQVTLDEPFLVGDDLCNIVHMRPVRLYELQKVSKAPRGKIDIALMQQQICGIPQASSLANVTGQIFDDDLYKQIKSLKDRKRLMKVSAKLQEIGPNMNLLISCYNCQNEWDSALPWGNLRTFLFDTVDEEEEDDEEEEIGA